MDEDDHQTRLQRILRLNPSGFRESNWLTRFVFLRGLGFIYLVAFLVTALQWEPLLGDRGILPVRRLLDLTTGGFWDFPSIFWVDASNTMLGACAWTGVALSVMVLFGFANAVILFALWVLYSSFVDVGQIFYGYGWEIMMLEVGFLAIFCAPPLGPKPFATKSPPATPVFWLLRWMLFRVMFGAGMIKMRGDECWRDLTCLDYHFETQPIPHVLSWYFDHMPKWVLHGGVAFNHFVELLMPFFVFGPKRARRAAGVIIIVFQSILILSGNLSFLNWLTIVIAFACFDDEFLRRFVPKFLRPRLDVRLDEAEQQPSRARAVVTWVLVAVVAVLSIQPTLNLVGERQVMNGSFDPLHIVNTYGAFGTVGRKRYQIVIEGTNDDPRDDDATWKAYEFECQPVRTDRAPCWITPYHLRLDWQIWFAGMSTINREPWLIHYVWMLLNGSPEALSLLAKDPFGGHPPKWIRIRRFVYRFTDDLDHGWRKRKEVGMYLPPISLQSKALRNFIDDEGFDATLDGAQ